MLLLEMQKVVKAFADRTLFQIDDLKLYAGDRIGIVGPNGAGKTTLLNIIAGELQPDSGLVKRHSDLAYIKQIGGLAAGQPAPELARRFQVRNQYAPTMSGGEKTRYKIAAAFSQDCPLLLADEPTANLDLDGVQLLEQKLSDFRGALVIISHDRALLNAICHTIWEIGSGRVRVYQGNYDAYLAAKAAERQRQQQEYEQFVRAKRNLEAAIQDRRARADSMRKTPARMGNSEARLHKMGNQKAKANLQRSVKAMESRLAKLSVKEKPKQTVDIYLDFGKVNELHSKSVIEVKGLSKRFGSRVLFENAEFSIASGQRTALIGGNGSGKTTLLKMILAGESGIRLSPAARIGYFSQEMDTLDLNDTVLGNVLAGSSQSAAAVRDLLARLLFRRDDVYKPVRVLSGGERVRVALAKLIAGDFNLLLMDEPTNYLDLPSLAAVEQTLADYPGTLLMVSHDRTFIDRVATNLLLIENKRVIAFAGTFSQYQAYRQERAKQAAREEKLLIEHRLAEVISKLSLTVNADEKALLDAEYSELIKKLRLC